MQLLTTISFIALLPAVTSQKAPGSVGLCQWDCRTDADCAPGLWCADGRKSSLREAGFDERKANCGTVGPPSDEVCFDPAILKKSKCQFDCQVDSDCKPGLMCADAHKGELVAFGHDARKADCGPVGPEKDEVCFDPAIIKKSGGAFGDPHFSTYDGTAYSYHGQCDLVLARSADFGGGLGLDIHARTTIVDSWSLIANAALRIGEEIFEVSNDGTHFLNGKMNVALPLIVSGQYVVTKGTKTFDSIDEHGKESTSEETSYVVDLGNSESIIISNYKSMISVQVNALLAGTEGMMGMHGKDGMIGRDRETVLDSPNDMGAQWQVTEKEPMLFNQVRAPQYPEACILPKTASRHLRQSPESRRLAVDVCSKVDKKMRQFCVDDVLMTGDIMVSNVYGSRN